MKSGILTIMKKELARFFGDKRTVAGVLLPGVMIYVLYSFMGTAMGSVFGVEEDYVPSIQAVRLPQSIAALADSAGMALTEGEEAGLPAAMAQVAGQELDPDFEIYHSTLILWSGDMKEPVVVEKPCESLDILPTLSNLFGLEYDSRLLMGQDILSDAPGLVMLSNKSFITELGRYNSKTDKFTPNEGVEVPEGYVSEIYREVKNLFRHSVNILEQDYYGKLGL